MSERLTIEEVLDLFTTVAEDFNVYVTERGGVRINSRTGKRITPALKATISRHFPAFVAATRADELAADAIIKARNVGSLDGIGPDLSGVPTFDLDGMDAPALPEPPAARTRRGRRHA